MTKKQQEIQLSELSTRIRQFEQDNQIVIQRYLKMGITVLDLYNEQEKLFKKYNQRWGYLSQKKSTLSI